MRVCWQMWPTQCAGDQWSVITPCNAEDQNHLRSQIVEHTLCEHTELLELDCPRFLLWHLEEHKGDYIIGKVENIIGGIFGQLKKIIGDGEYYWSSGKYHLSRKSTTLSSHLCFFRCLGGRQLSRFEVAPIPSNSSFAIFFPILYSSQQSWLGTTKLSLRWPGQNLSP